MNTIKPIDINMSKEMEYHLKLLKIVERECRKLLMIPNHDNE